MKRLSLLIGLLLVGLSTYSQQIVNNQDERMFFGALEVGANFSTVNGDLRGGYSHVGLHIGPSVYFKFNRSYPWFGSIGLRYSEKGAHTVTRQGSDIGDYLETYKINVNYVQMPIDLHYLYNERYLFSVGAAFNYLVGHNESLIDTWGTSDFTDDSRLKFENTNFDLRLGVGYMFGKNWMLSAKYEMGLTPIRFYKNTYGPPLSQADQYNALFQFNITYLF